MWKILRDLLWIFAILIAIVLGLIAGGFLFLGYLKLVTG